MEITQKEFVAEFSEKIRLNQSSIFIGAGVSKSIGLPSWKELFQEPAKKLGLSIDDIYDFYQLSQYYCNKYSVASLKRTIQRDLLTSESSNETLEKIFKLNFKSIWTTNFDTAIENCLIKNKIKSNKVFNDKDLANINIDIYSTLYKINGDINDLENLVLTQEDWENFKVSRPIMLTFLKRELVTNTFLFIGYSFNDNLIKSVLSEIKQFVGNEVNHHYAIFKRENSLAFQYFIDDLEIRYNVKSILIDDFDEIPKILDNTYQQLIKRNVFISGSLGEIDSKIETYGCNLLKKISTELLKNHYNISTGMGRKIGYFVAGPSIQYLLSNNLNIEERLKIRPFDDSMNHDEFTNYRTMLIDNNNVVIFVFGQKQINGKDTNSKGVIEEFILAKRQGKYIIPIGSTGYASQYIWKEVKENILFYPYLEKYIDELNKELKPEVLSSIVLAILEDIID